jgi:hypothetical protein
MYSLEEVAEKLGTTELHVLMHIKKGLLEGSEIDGQWYIKPESFEAFQHGEAPPKSSIIQCKSHCGGCSGATERR